MTNGTIDAIHISILSSYGGIANIDRLGSFDHFQMLVLQHIEPNSFTTKTSVDFYCCIFDDFKLVTTFGAFHGFDSQYKRPINYWVDGGSLASASFSAGFFEGFFEGFSAAGIFSITTLAT